jgi:hypothetical protein
MDERYGPLCFSENEATEEYRKRFVAFNYKKYSKTIIYRYDSYIIICSNLGTKFIDIKSSHTSRILFAISLATFVLEIMFCSRKLYTIYCRRKNKWPSSI